MKTCDNINGWIRSDPQERKENNISTNWQWLIKLNSKWLFDIAASMRGNLMNEEVKQ